MKKTILIVAGALVIASCSNENLAITSQESSKTEAMKDFAKAMKTMTNPRNQATPEEKRMKSYPELSERRKDLLIPSAKELIKSEGISDAEIEEKTDGNKGAIINWALNIYFDYKKTNNYKN
ncbi:hypothetical protein [Chryseobacterium sp. MMS23-Vi53]|uniref:hypothetical protein n=1 Tax=Chryseobacterium sp. MMS23-Vi53 TaxID=3386644 RepID=UPI0039E99040